MVQTTLALGVHQSTDLAKEPEFYLLFIYLIFVYLQREKETADGQRAPNCWFTPQMPTVALFHPKVRTQSRSPLSRTPLSEPSPLCLKSALSRKPERGAEPGSHWTQDLQDGIELGIFACGSTVHPTVIFFQTLILLWLIITVLY